MGFQIKYYGLDVLYGLRKLVKFLIATGLVVENANDEIPVDDSPATGSVLQDFLCLVKIYQSVFELVPLYFL